MQARTLADSAQWTKALQLLSALQRQQLWLGGTNEPTIFGSTIQPQYTQLFSWNHQIAHGPHGWDVIMTHPLSWQRGHSTDLHTWALQHPAPVGVTRPSAANPRCPDVVLVTSVLNACGRAAYVDRAILLFEDMRRWSIDPSPVSYAAVINACAKCGWMVDKP